MELMKDAHKPPSVFTVTNEYSMRGRCLVPCLASLKLPILLPCLDSAYLFLSVSLLRANSGDRLGPGRREQLSRGFNLLSWPFETFHYIRAIRCRNDYPSLIISMGITLARCDGVALWDKCRPTRRLRSLSTERSTISNLKCIAGRWNSDRRASPSRDVVLLEYWHLHACAGQSSISYRSGSPTPK